jgi:hypothetical protein
MLIIVIPAFAKPVLPPRSILLLSAHAARREREIEKESERERERREGPSCTPHAAFRTFFVFFLLFMQSHYARCILHAWAAGHHLAFQNTHESYTES